MKNLPEIIYLNLGEEVSADSDFRELSEVTWSEKKMFDSDIAYTRKPQWISVEKELPEDNILVVVWIFGSTVLTDFCEDGKWHYQGVRFWMPLPELPSLPDTNTEKR